MQWYHQMQMGLIMPIAFNVLQHVIQYKLVIYQQEVILGKRIKDLTLLLEDKQQLKRMPNEGTIDVPQG